METSLTKNSAEANQLKSNLESKIQDLENQLTEINNTLFSQKEHNQTLQSQLDHQIKDNLNITNQLDQTKLDKDDLEKSTLE